MAVLSDADRKALNDALMADASATRTGVPLTKAQLRAAVDAADTWANDNAAEFNSALPTAARNGLTSKQKARLLLFVIRRRYEVEP